MKIKKEVKKWVNEKISFVTVECDLTIEKNKNILDNLKNIEKKLEKPSSNLTQQTKTWLKERIKYISENAEQTDTNAIKTLNYFKFIQSM